MKYNTIYLFLFINLILTAPLVFAFDDQTTHKDLTSSAIDNSKLNSYLINYLSINGVGEYLKRELGVRS